MPPRSRGAAIAAIAAMSVMRVVSAAPIAAQINPATTPLRANFLAEDAARAYDVITYEGPSYDGCCPLPENGGGGGGDAGGEILGCCATGGCCPSSETTDAYGVYLACCTAQRGTMDENRARSRVWYTGPSYDGCCPNGDGLNMGCCASAAGCCPRDGGARHACCPTMALQDDLDGVDAREDSEIMDMRGNENEYDDVNGDDGMGTSYDAQGIARRSEYEDATGAVGEYARGGLQDERVRVDGDDMSTMYLQLAAVVCVVVWAAALVANTMYAKFDGRDDGVDEEAEALLVRNQRRRGAMQYP
jgi:hypothetical protein